MIVAAASLPGVRLGVITHDPQERAPEWARSSIHAHWRVDSILDPEQLVDAARGLARIVGMPVTRMFGAYEQAQVPIALARETLASDRSYVAPMQTVHRLRKSAQPSAKQFDKIFEAAMGTRSL